MKRFELLSVFMITAMFSSFAHAADLTVEDVSKRIVGEWRLLSFEKGGKQVEDYSKEKIVWRFSHDGNAFISDRQLGEFTDGYRVLKSKYGWIGKGGILILIKELKNRGFSHPKFMVRGIAPGGELLLGDWDNTLIYRLVRAD